MITFLEIPKNAHSTASMLHTCFEPQPEYSISVLILRDPLQRFWSAAKTIHPELSFYGDFPHTADSYKKAPKNYKKVKVTCQEAIDLAKDRLGKKPDMTPHLETQISFIGDKKFQNIITVENMLADLKDLASQYGVTLHADRVPTHNASVTDWDDEALEIIKNDKKIKKFYAADIALYADPSAHAEPFSDPKIGIPIIPPAGGQ